MNDDAKQRRERIATAALQGMLANPEQESGAAVLAKFSLVTADALIAELDKATEADALRDALKSARARNEGISAHLERQSAIIADLRAEVLRLQTPAPVAAADEPTLEAQLAQVTAEYRRAFAAWLDHAETPDAGVHALACEVKRFTDAIAARDKKGLTT